MILSDVHRFLIFQIAWTTGFSDCTNSHRIHVLKDKIERVRNDENFSIFSQFVTNVMKQNDKKQKIAKKTFEDINTASNIKILTEF